jgi:ATP-dependent DNA helicase RecG
VTVTLFNLERPSAWDEVSDWIDREGFIQNAKLCEIARVDTLKASKMLRAWVDRGLLELLPGRVRSNAAYRRPAQSDQQLGLLQGADDNEGGPSAG